MLNLTETTLESLSLLEDVLLQEKIGQHRERMQTTMESGKLRRRLELLIQRKKGEYLRRKEKSSKEIKGPHPE
jgi:hypothetical protein